MDLNLFWRGPLRSGSFPTDPESFENLNQGGIYLRLKLYKNGRTVAYVGQSRTLISRFDQHLTRLLSLRQPLRDVNGLVVEHCGTENRFVLLNGIAEMAPLAIEEILRTEFYFALAQDGFDINYLTLIEAMLKKRAENIMREQLENIQRINPGEFDHEISIVSDFSYVDVRGCQLIEGVIGSTPIQIPMAQQDLAHAG